MQVEEGAVEELVAVDEVMWLQFSMTVLAF